MKHCRKFKSALTLLSVASGFLLSACESAPRPAMPDGGSRTQVNDPARIAALRAAALGAQVDVSTRVRQADELAQLRGEVATLKDALRSLLQPKVSPPSQSQGTPAAPVATPAIVAPPPAASDPASKAAPGQAGVSHEREGQAPIVIRTVLLFGSGSATPLRGLDPALGRSAALASKIAIAAYTDATGSAHANRALAQARARSVGKALIDAGAQPTSLAYKLAPQREYVASNDHEPGRSRNRRVEVSLFIASAQAIHTEAGQ